MRNDPDSPRVVTTAGNEAEAAMIVAVLLDAGIEAQAEGGLTSAMRAEVPGQVNILVHQSDLAEAERVLAENCGDVA